jgi:drug/metabolite transporter (DMT)-like permease
MASITSSALIALAAAACWGGGDFSGGMGVKAASRTGADATEGALRLVVAAHSMSFVILCVFLAVRGGWRWSEGPGLWALGAGVAAGVSLTAFYMALARGAMGVSAAVSGLLAAAIPAVVSSFLEGRPGVVQLAGFALAGVAIWVIAAGPSPENAEGGTSAAGTMGLAVVGGLGFGIYFVGLRLANSLRVAEPMALARAGSLLACVALLGGVVWRRAAAAVPVRFTREMAGWAVGVAVLDTSGNLLFVQATRMGRLDVAAVLASLYPASTILLAAWRLHERPTRRQVMGMLVALAAVVMITM